MASDAWQERLSAMIPSQGRSLAKEPELLAKIRERSARVLALAGDQGVLA